MTDQHPITPPPELVKKWVAMLEYCEDIDVFTDVARWGADQELEACCNHMRDHQWGFVERPDGTKIHRAVYLQQSRRPKPSSLKEQALAWCNDYIDPDGAIRRALEQLDD